MNNPYLERYRNMHLIQHTYEVEKALLSRRLASSSLTVQRDAQLCLSALEIRWQEVCEQNRKCLALRTNKLKDITTNSDAIDTPTEEMVKAEKPKRKRAKKKKEVVE